ncbi:MAG: sigma-70 family RNA polymerase sigma factor [bacterium]|nr:sigma-70 family RNA polymerase sigma factor [bacterium]
MPTVNIRDEGKRQRLQAIKLSVGSVGAALPGSAGCFSSDRSVRDKLIFDNRTQAHKIGRSMLRKWRVTLPYGEAESLVDLTLCEVADRFDASKGASFITFFFYHLRGNLVRTVASYSRNNANFSAFHGDSSFELVKETTRLGGSEFALASDISGYGAFDSSIPEENMIREEREDICRQAFAGLDPLEREVLERSFELDQSLVGIAEELGYSRCHISRVKKKALEKMKVTLAGCESIAPVARDPQLARPKKQIDGTSVRGRKRRALSVAGRDKGQGRLRANVG